jgi:tetratricopeptide (TPR) repeat protein
MSLDTEATTPTGERTRLEQERDFLLRSIEDLDAERDAGDVSEADHAALRAQYTARAAAVLRALDGDRAPRPDERASPASASASAPSPAAAQADTAARRPRRRWLLWSALGLFAAAAAVVVVCAVTARLPGETASGTVRLSSAEQLQRTLGQAQLLESEGKASRALALYHEVLTSDPSQEQALAESGWLEYEAGVSARNGRLLSTGQATELRAERVDPGAYAPHLYLGSMLLVEGRAADAASEFSLFLASDPPVAAEQAAWPFVVRAFGAAGRSLPPTPPGVSG